VGRTGSGDTVSGFMLDTFVASLVPSMWKEIELLSQDIIIKKAAPTNIILFVFISSWSLFAMGDDSFAIVLPIR
jgi:hypothetical protein